MSKILFRGNCDVTAITQYIKQTSDIVVESAFKGKYLDTVWDASISLYLMQSATGRTIENKFVEPAFYPSPEIYRGGKYDGIIISCIGDGILGVYENITDGSRLAYGIWTSDATKNDGEDFFNPNIAHGGLPNLSKEDYHWFAQHYKYLGRTSIDDCVSNYEVFIEKVPQSTKIIMLLGPTILNVYGERNTALKNGGKEFHAQLNTKLVSVLSKYSNVYFINPSKYYKKPKNKYDMFYYGCPSIDHYPCITYLKMAKEISKIISGKKIKVNYLFYIKQKIRRTKKRIREFIQRIVKK